MRIDDAVSHTALGGKIGNPYLAQQTYSITLKTGLVDDTGILQDLLLETDPTQQFTLFTLGSMIFKVFTEVTLVTSLSDSITHGWQLHVHHVLKLGYEFVEPQGAFYLWVKALEPDANAFFERAKSFELLPVPSDSFGCPGWVRVGYCVSHETIVNSMPAWKKLAESYK